MKFTRTTYEGSPCWNLKGHWIWSDIDWNTRFPFGFSACVRFGPKSLDRKRPGFTLDLNAPEGEPNRLYLWLGRWSVTIGLISWHTFRKTGRCGNLIEGTWVRCWPHLENRPWIERTP